MTTNGCFKKIFFSIYSYTIIYALFGVLSLSYHACFNSSLSTLEKRYHFSSSTGGYIMITDNIATLLTNLFIGYYGKTAHKPRWMSIGCVVTGLSVMITALPYFIYGPAHETDLQSWTNMTASAKSKSGDQMCLASDQPEDCSDMTSTGVSIMTMVAVSCFAISNFFRGFGTSIYFTYGTPYLDDNVSKAKMPTFFAFIFAARILGAPIGYALSALALTYYENPLKPPPNMTNTDPRWIGAWWIGFLASGVLMLLLAIPLATFPREFKSNKNRRENEREVIELAGKSETAPVFVSFDRKTTQNGEATVKTTNHLSSGNENSEEDVKKATKNDDMSLKNLPREVFEILSNPIIICQMLGNLFRGIGIIGFFVFQPRYMESQFRQSAAKASLVSGTTGFVGKIVGVLVGGMIITFFRPKGRVLTIFIFIVELSSVFTLLWGATVFGPQYAYPGTIMQPNGQLDLKNGCNPKCHCDHVRYQPVCEPKAMNAYFSPCHAGCKTSYKNLDGSPIYTECDCTEGGVESVQKCPADTDKLKTYATIIAFGGMVSGSSRPGNMVTFFRSINPEQKTLAVAVGSFWHSLFVSIPYPILYGKIFDNYCLVWGRECSQRGNCWLYDTEKLRVVYHGVSIALIALGSMFDLIMIFLSPRLGNLYDDDGKNSLRERIMFWKVKQEDPNDVENHPNQRMIEGQSKAVAESRPVPAKF